MPDDKPGLQIKALFDAAAEIASKSERATYLDHACAGDQNLRRQVDTLLRALDEAGSFLEVPAQYDPEAAECDATTSGSSSAHAGDSPTATGIAAVDETGASGPPQRLESPSARSIMEAPGSLIGPYKLLQRIGEGGMGAVYLAEQERPVRRRVALKVIKPGMDTEQVVARFEAERQALAIMDHPSIAKVFDAGVTDSGRPYFVMELVKGVPITEYCDTVHLTPKERLELFIPVCQAIQHAHQKGIIHRDIKPSNVLVAMQDGKPVPKVIDFGIAKAIDQRLTEKTFFTEHGAIIGTLEYMSPEQAEMSMMDIDTRADIYALGVLLYELLTGSTPLERVRLREAGYSEILRRIREEEPPKPSTRLSESRDSLPSVAAMRKTEPARLTRLMRGDLDWIVMKALEKDRTRRYESASGFARDIERHFRGEPVEAGPPGAFYRLRKLARKHRTALFTAAGFAFLLIAATVISSILAIRAHRAEQAALADRNRAIDAERLARQRLGEISRANAAAENALAETRAAKRSTEKALAQSEESRKQAEAVAAFMTRAFRSPDPTRDGRSVTVAELLDGATGSLRREFGGSPQTRGTLLAALGRTYFGLGLFNEAVSTLTPSDRIHQEVLGPDHRESLEVRIALAQAECAVGRVVEAVARHEAILRTCEATLGPDDLTTLESRSGLADAYYAAGRAADAIRLDEATLKVREAMLGTGDPLAIASRNNLARDYLSVDRIPEAIDLFRSALRLKEALDGPEHPDTLATRGNLAMALLDAGKADDAIALQKLTLKHQQTKLGPDHPTTLNTRGHVALAYKAAGRTREAITEFESTLKLQEARLGADHPETITTRVHLAACYQDAGQSERAIALLEPARKLLEANAGAANPHTLATRRNLANAYGLAGRYREAADLDEETARLAEASLGPAHSTTLHARSSLAVLDMELGKTREAIILLESVRKIREAVFGPDHPDTLMTINNLANAYLDSGRFVEAAALFEKALKGYEAKFGPNHPDTQWSRNNLSAAYFRADRIADAAALVEGVLRWREATLGPDHPDTLVSRNNLGSAYRRIGQINEAVALHEANLRLSEAKLGPNHPQTVYRRASLAQSYAAAGRLANAIALYEPTLPLMEATFGPAHLDTIRCRGGLANANLANGRVVEAVALHEKNLGLAKKELGPDHPDTTGVLQDLAEAYLTVGRAIEAEALGREGLDRASRKLGSDNSRTAGLMDLLGRILIERQKWDEAEATLRRCLAVREKTQPDDWTTFDTRSSLGSCLLQRAAYTAAEPLIIDGYEGMKAREARMNSPLARIRQLPDAAERIVRLYQAWGKPGRAAAWRARLALVDLPTDVFAFP